MSAVRYVFEDSVGYHNQDSMGTDVIITPGSLLWTWAGSGVTHHEVPNSSASSDKKLIFTASGDNYFLLISGPAI